MTAHTGTDSHEQENLDDKQDSRLDGTGRKEKQDSRIAAWHVNKGPGYSTHEALNEKNESVCIVVDDEDGVWCELDGYTKLSQADLEAVLQRISFIHGNNDK